MKDSLPKNEIMLWLVSYPSALRLANNLDGVSVLPRPFQNSKFVNIAI